MRVRNIIPKSIIVLYFLTLFAFPIGDMILDIRTLRLYLYSILNTVTMVYILTDDSHNNYLSKIIKGKLSLIILGFITWGLLSYIYAFNKTEVIVRIFTFVNFYITYLVFAVLIRGISFRHIAYFFTLILLSQVSVSLWQIDTLTALRNYDFSMNSQIIGIFSNRNVTAAIYLLQLPFLIYLIIELKNKFFKASLFFLGLLVVYVLFLLASRTSYVVMIVLTLSNLLFFLINKEKLTSLLKTYSSYLSSMLVVGFIIAYFSLGSENEANPINRLQSIEISETSANTRLRYYTIAVKDFVSSPIIGYGLGNFKIISIERDKENISSYIIPYTMHNDFLEVAVELGIIGLVLFILIFIYPVILFLRPIKLIILKLNILSCYHV